MGRGRMGGEASAMKTAFGSPGRMPHDLIAPKPAACCIAAYSRSPGNSCDNSWWYDMDSHTIGSESCTATSQGDSNTRPLKRRRIPVACVPCRTRKSRVGNVFHETSLQC